MYGFFVALQFIVLIMMLVIFLFISWKRPSRVQSAALTLFACMSVIAMAYFFVLTSQQVEVMRAMYKIQLICINAVAVSTLWFCACFCKFKIPKWLFITEFVIALGLVVLVLSEGLHSWIFQDFTMLHDGTMFRCTFKPSWGYTAICANLAAVLLYCAFCCIRSLKNCAGVEKRRVYWVTIGVCAPALFAITKLFIPQDNADSVSYSLVVESVCFMFAFVRYGYFDSVQAATANFIEYGTEGFIILTTGLQIRTINPVAKKLFPNYHVGSSAKGDRLIAEMLDKTQKTVEMDERIYDVRVETVVDTGFQQGYFIWLIDMTENHHLMDEMERLTRWATTASTVKSDFLTSMSHEIRTPMNAVLGMNHMIMRETSDKKLLGYAENIERAGNSLLGIINDILDISQIENGELEIKKTEYSVSSLVTDLYNLTVWRAQEKNLELRLDVDPKIPDRLQGDEVRIRQVMTNLMGNAIKYTKEGHVEISISWQYKENVADTIDLRFAVTDTGVGISAEDQAKLFQDFVRLDKVKNRSIEGTGLGLSISKQLINLMEGEIFLESEPGKGSCFYFVVPQKVLDSSPVGDLATRLMKKSERKDIAAPTFFAPETNVLLVDDNDMNLMVYSELLRRTGMHVSTAASGAECIALMGTNRYSILLLDHMMPELDGVETLKRLRQMDLLHGTPVIALTANAVVGAKEMYLEMGFDDYVPKSVEPQYLESVIARHLKPQEMTQPEAQPQSLLLLEPNAERLTAIRGILKDSFKLAPTKSVEQAKAYLGKHRPTAVLCAASEAERARAELGSDTELIIISCDDAPVSGKSLKWPFTAQDVEKLTAK